MPKSFGEGIPAKYRNRVLGLLALLLIITYLDRVCISVAGPRIQEAFHLGPVAWGWVASVFTIAYAVFEIPTGVMGDRIGPRRVLTRIVLWWSAFTTLTGLATGYVPLLITRFFFGMGEAGAFPNASIAVARWFPLRERGRAFGVVLMSGQLGGALAPLLVVPIQARWGWRASFYVFGILGVIWSAVWYKWFRDSPGEMAGISTQELHETREVVVKGRHSLPWMSAMRSVNFWSAMCVAFCYIYAYYFFQSWFHTYLVKARGFAESDLLLSSLPYLVAAITNLSGGLLSNIAVRKWGLRWGRRSIAVVGLLTAAVCAVAVMFTHHPIGALILLSLIYGGVTLQQPIMFALCLDIGGEYAGAIVGSMNTAAQVGSFLSSLAFGYIVDRFHSYDLPFVPMAVLLVIGAALWLRIDATERLSAAASQPQLAHS